VSQLRLSLINFFILGLLILGVFVFTSNNQASLILVTASIKGLFSGLVLNLVASSTLLVVLSISSFTFGLTLNCSTNKSSIVDKSDTQCSFNLSLVILTSFLVAELFSILVVKSDRIVLIELLTSSLVKIFLASVFLI
jgi:hypothetical protein